TALCRAARRGLGSAICMGMAGKIAELAAGVMMTHFHRSKVDGDLMAEVAREAGAPPPVLDAATATETARHFFEVCVERGCVEPLELLCRRARRNCRAHVEGALDIDVVMVDFEGAAVVATSYSPSAVVDGKPV